MAASIIAALPLIGLLAASPPQAQAVSYLGTCTQLNYTDHEVCLNDPQGTTTQQQVLVARLKDLADSAGEGDTVRIAMYRWSTDDSVIDQFTDALKAAAARGASIQILLDDGNTSKDIGNLETDFPNDVTVCSPSTCLANSGDQHNKLFLFTIGGQNTTVISSINLADGMYTKYANMVILHNELLSFYDHYFDRMVDDNWDGWTTSADRTKPGISGKIRAYVYPQLTSDDTVADILNAITECDSGANTVWLLANQFTLGRLTSSSNRLLNAFDGVPGTCDLRVILEDISSDRPDPTVIQDLRNAGATVRFYAASPLHHSKYVLVHAKTTALVGPEGTGWHNYVWTGSANMGTGIWSGDNSNVLVQDSTGLAAYEAQFSYLWSQSQTQPAT
ncbi:phospholipase D-like domain-containing protein [Nocardioides terrisoli]|uniref:phospholipase D-like domain-containing protein n=1 Tax=Nocardioides terrisoli TaxID=3388267 RepID=UPI00287B8921|nr:phospholipase D-like domain-containing protein [Nocardioides marmorisolisilvae]